LVALEPILRGSEVKMGFLPLGKCQALSGTVKCNTEKNTFSHHPSANGIASHPTFRLCQNLIMERYNIKVEDIKRAKNHEDNIVTNEGKLIYSRE